MPKRYFSNRRRLGSKRRMYARKRLGGYRSKRARLNRRLVTVGHLHRALSREREDKVASRRIAFSDVFNQTIGNADIYPLMPRIAQGTGALERVGRQVRTRYMFVNLMLTVSVDPGLTSNYPINYRILFLNWKGARNEARLVNVPISDLLMCNDDAGAAINLPYNGLADAHMMPVNTQSFSVLRDIRGKFYPQDAVLNDGPQQPLPGIVRSLRVRIRVPKTLLFDTQATGANTPTNYAPFMCAGWCYANNLATNIGDTRLMLTARSYLMYEDA